MTKLTINKFPYMDLPAITVISGPPNTYKTALASLLLKEFKQTGIYIGPNPIFSEEIAKQFSECITKWNPTLCGVSDLLLNLSVDTTKPAPIVVIDDVGEILKNWYGSNLQNYNETWRIQKELFVTLLKQVCVLRNMRFIVIEHVPTKLNILEGFGVELTPPEPYGNWTLSTSTTEDRYRIMITSMVGRSQVPLSPAAYIEGTAPVIKGARIRKVLLSEYDPKRSKTEYLRGISHIRFSLIVNYLNNGAVARCSITPIGNWGVPVIRAHLIKSEIADVFVHAFPDSNSCPTQSWPSCEWDKKSDTVSFGPG